MTSSQRPAVSVVIPALNESESIAGTLLAVSQLVTPVEIIVVDGGSYDDTPEIARRYGARVISSEQGRGTQMHRGACTAHGDVLWFLHADTVVPLDGVDLILEALVDERMIAGNFGVCFDGPGAAARFMTGLYPQLRRLGLCYGDSAIFVRREAYERSGGFSPLPIFEDLDLLRRLKRLGKFVHVPGSVVTSGRRFEGGRFLYTFIRWIGLQLLYWLGFHPRQLGRLYAPVRENAIKEARARNSSSSADI